MLRKEIITSNTILALSEMRRDWHFLGLDQMLPDQSVGKGPQMFHEFEQHVVVGLALKYDLPQKNFSDGNC